MNAYDAEATRDMQDANPSPGADCDQISLEEQARLLTLQQTILETVALGRGHREIIDQICLLEEQLLPNAVASVMLLDEQHLLNVYAAPSIPSADIARLSGLRPGPGGGSCGNVVYREEPVFVGDTLTDPRWADLRQLAQDFDLRACWSMPVRGPGGAIIGTFALSSFEHRMPTPFHRKMLEIGASIVGIVLERRRQHDALQVSEMRYRQLFEVNQAIKLVIDPRDGRIVDANSAAAAFYGYPRERLLQLSFADINTLPSEAVAAALHEIETKRHLHNLFTHRLASGEERNVEVYSGPLSDGERTLLYSIIHDITDRKQVQDSLQYERDFVNAIFDTVGSVVAVIDRQGAIVRFNHAAERYTGYTFEEVRGKPFFWERFLVPEQAVDVRQVFEQIWRGQGSSRFENYWVHRDGTRRLFDWTNTRLQDDGTEGFLISTGTDITERKQAEQALRLAVGVFENTQEGIVVTNQLGNVVDINPAFSTMTGFRKGDVVGKHFRLLQSGQLSRSLNRTIWSAVRENGHWSGEVRGWRRDGSTYDALVNVSAIVDQAGEATRYVAVYTDISVLKRQEIALKHMAHYDALTGLPNRVLLADRIRQALAQTRRADGLMAVAYLDLDGFKPINDHYGHDVGDMLLVEIARRISVTLRGSDTVARFGGDEFVILLPAVHDREESESILERIHRAIIEPVLLDGDHGMLSVGASIGLTLYEGGDVDADSLLRQADQAMYQAKRDGRGQMRIFRKA